MRDVAIAKSEFVKDEKAITKIQTWHTDDVLWEFCCLPQASHGIRLLYPDTQVPRTMISFDIHVPVLVCKLKDYYIE